MNLASAIVGLFGLFNIVGGIMGYAKSGSMPSLITGGISGLVLLLCSYGITKDLKWAGIVAFFVAFLLGGRFFRSLFITFKVMPSLIVVLFSLATFIVVGAFLFKK